MAQPWQEVGDCDEKEARSVVWHLDLGGGGGDGKRTSARSTSRPAFVNASAMSRVPIEPNRYCEDDIRRKFDNTQLRVTHKFYLSLIRYQ
jgi:hypothetical protein